MLLVLPLGLDLDGIDLVDVHASLTRPDLFGGLVLDQHHGELACAIRVLRVFAGDHRVSKTPRADSGIFGLWVALYFVP